MRRFIRLIRLVVLALVSTAVMAIPAAPASAGTSGPVTVRDTFQVSGPARSAVTFTRENYQAHGWRLKVKVTRAGRPWARRRVEMQARCYGSWGKLLAKKTNARGRVDFTSVPQGPNSRRICGVRADRLPIRFHVAGTWNTRPAVSRTFNLWRR